MDVQHKLTIPLILLAAVLLVSVVLAVQFFAGGRPNEKQVGTPAGLSAQEREAVLHSLNGTSSASSQMKLMELSKLPSTPSGSQSTASSATVPENAADQSDPNAAAKLKILNGLNQP